MKTKPIIRNFLSRAAMTLGGRQAVTLAGVMTRRFTVMITLLLMTAAAWAVKPTTNLEVCRGEAYSIYVRGWAFDKDAPDYSLSVKVYVYSDAACKNEYTKKTLYTGYVDRPDVVTVHSLPSGSKPGFEGRIPITDPGIYYVKVYAIDIDNEGEDITNSSTEMSNSFNPVTVTTLTTIGSAADWNTFVTVIKSGEDFAGKTLTLTADIPTAEEIAAGTTAVTTITSEEKAFCGTFDGQGHTINVDLNASGNTATGLFSYVKGATIKDLTVTGTINNTGMYAGGLVGTAKGATIQNCTLAATINSSGNEVGAFVGGCSQIDADTPGNLTLQDCIFSGSIHITGSYGDSKSAGLVSVWNNTSLTISNCLVKGSFSSERSGAQFYPIAFKTADATVTANVSDAYYLNTLPVTTSGENVITGAKGMAVSTTETEEYNIPVTAADGLTYYFPERTVTSSTTEWRNGLYEVTSDVTINSRITVIGTVILNLGEGCTLTVPKGIELSSGNQLTINGPGTLTIDDCDRNKSGIGAYEGGTLIINSGTVSSKGGICGAGIGGDKENTVGLDVTINGGIVNAYGGYGSAGIGGGCDDKQDGNYGVCGTIVISGGQVTAIGGANAYGFGPGYCSAIGTNKTTRSGTMKLGWTEMTDFIYATGGALNKSGGYSNRINDINLVEGKELIIDGTNQIATRYLLIQGSSKLLPKDVHLGFATISGVKSVYDYTGSTINISYTVTTPTGNALTEGTNFTGVITNSSNEIMTEVRAMDAYTLTITGQGLYRGTQQFCFTVLGITPVTSETTTMTTGTYRVTEDVTIESRIIIDGKVNLILNEGTVLNAKCGIEVESDNTLIIEGLGTLRATGTHNSAGIGGTYKGLSEQSEHGHIIINGGIIIAQGAQYAAAIGGAEGNTVGSNSIVEINGGIINATGGLRAAGIGGGYNIIWDNEGGKSGVIIINGGQVTVRGGSYAPAGIGRGEDSPDTSGSLTLGWTNASDFIDVDSYDIGSISFAQGKSFVIYGDWNTAATVANIGGKKIVPPSYRKSIATAIINDLKYYYPYSGSAFRIHYSVTSFDNTPLTEGTHYSTELRNSNNMIINKTAGEYELTDVGEYTITFIGINPYDDRITKHFIVSPTLSADESGAFVIQNAADWELFYKDVNRGTEFYDNKTVRLTEDISISNAVGTNEHLFRGTFDGQGHTLTVNITDTKSQGTAPFRYISDATIQYVKVTGTVSGNMHCSGLVGFAQSGTNIIRSCEVAVDVNSSGSHCGGILGHGTSSNTTIRNCLFSGSISGATTATGIIYGWGDSGTHTIENCLSAGTYSGGGIELIHSGNYQTITNCYRKTTGGTQGTDASSMSNEELAAALGGGWRVDNDQVVPIMNAMNIGTVNFSGIKNYYLYTGEPISIDYIVTAVDGTPLEKGTHYTETISPSTVLAKGDYTLTITGKAPYTGSQTFHFTVGDGRPVTLETTTMETGPYRVTEDVTIESRITIKGDVLLILDEGVTLNAVCGIGVESRNTLTIEGSGTLQAKGSFGNAGIGGSSNYNNSGSEHGHIIINSGTIIAKGGVNAAGIGGGSDSRAGSNSVIEINGGVVNATGGDERQFDGVFYPTIDLNGAGIGGGYRGETGIITINGGQVTARGQQDYAAGIGRGYYSKDTNGSLTLGWSKASDFIDVDIYDIGSISFTEGKSFVIFGDWNTVATVENMGGKKIVPPGYRNDVASATIGSLQDYYVYSGSALSISYSVVSADNTPLTEGTHYTTELRNSSGVAINKTNGSYQLKDMGGYTLIFTGINSFGGTLEKKITVVPPAPNLTIDDWNHQEATLTWQTPVVDVTLMGYAYQYKKTDELQWYPVTTLPASSTSFTLNGLSPVTSYDFRVKAVYGDYESLYQSVSFTTGVELPYDCGFENGMDGWVTYNIYSIWSKIRNTEKYEGEYSFVFGESDIYPIQYLISPRFSADVISVSFHYKGEWYNSKFQVGYSTTTNDISAFTWGDVVDVPLSWQLYEQDFPKGTRYVAIKADFSNDGSDIFVDDFHFMEAGIKKPVNLAIGEISKTSATVTWTAPSTTLAVAGYAYQYKRANDGGWSDETTTTATSVTISNLAPSTTYQVRVKTLYASGESLYETADFTTIVALPYTDGFENGIGGWTIVDGYYAIQTLYTGISSHGKRNGDNGFEFFRDNTRNQYLISPQLEGAAPMIVSFYHAIDTYEHHEDFKIGYSTTTSDISAFTWSDLMTSTSTQWQKYENTFPKGTKYIAFNYTPTDNFRMYLDDFSFAYVPASVTFAKEGYGTYYNGSLDAVLPAGVKAYIVTASSGGGSLTYQTIADGDSETKTVLAGTAVMLQTKASNSTRIIEIPLESPSAGSIYETNLLHGSDVAVETSGGGNGAEYYRLSYDTNGKKAGWYWGAADGAAFTSAAHEAWLALPAGAGAGGFLMLPSAGDANGDGKVDAADIVEMVNAMNGNVSTYFNWDNADFDGNHTITDYDINEVVKIIMGE